jgi:hypothetical protein
MMNTNASVCIHHDLHSSAFTRHHTHLHTHTHNISVFISILYPPPRLSVSLLFVFFSLASLIDFLFVCKTDFFFLSNCAC